MQAVLPYPAAHRSFGLRTGFAESNPRPRRVAVRRHPIDSIQRDGAQPNAALGGLVVGIAMRVTDSP